ncbi:hypothetical protein IFR05_004480 [Cadophora sp. M221]|nr:hypothetical protein IFR05_004480 [Cadophora sp. M221]
MKDEVAEFDPVNRLKECLRELRTFEALNTEISQSRQLSKLEDRRGSHIAKVHRQIQQSFPYRQVFGEKDACYSISVCIQGL